jgi:phi13 family phage major tail protein
MSDTYVGKPIGARKLTMWPLTADTAEGATYGEPVKLSRLINIVVTPVFAEGLLESDDTVEDELAQVIAYDVTINASQLTDEIRGQLLGHAFNKGGILTTDSDQPIECAIAWEELLSKKSGTNKYKKVVLYKGTFREFAETANTKVRSGTTYQTHNLVGRFYAREDGHIKYSMREDTADADPTQLAAWFEEPQEYDETVTPEG